MKTKEEFQEALRRVIDDAPLPPLGSSKGEHAVILSEAEVNSLAYAIAFVESAQLSMGFRKQQEHYGPTLHALLERLLLIQDAAVPPAS